MFNPTYLGNTFFLACGLSLTRFNKVQQFYSAFVDHRTNFVNQVDDFVSIGLPRNLIYLIMQDNGKCFSREQSQKVQSLKYHKENQLTIPLNWMEVRNVLLSCYIYCIQVKTELKAGGRNENKWNISFKCFFNIDFYSSKIQTYHFKSKLKPSVDPSQIRYHCMTILTIYKIFLKA